MAYEYITVPTILILVFLILGLRKVNEYERAVILRLGRYIGIKGPGLFWLIPFVDKAIVVDKRVQVIDIPKQEAITIDNVPTYVNAVVFYSITDASKAIIKVQNYRFAIMQLAQTTMRSAIGAVNLDDLLSNRDKINEHILEVLDEATDEWGIDCRRVEIKDLELPENMKRAMAKQAESERERRSRIILAEGEMQASKKLAEASAIMAESGGIYLRLLQTIQEISTENSSTVILPFPADLTGLSGNMFESIKKSLNK
ncbi:MAG: slipin family protein [Candidatus Heimdallarchaeota archaeon]|nr:slipin family protein [Candidatus Heimdallarchaeota archaeon]